MKHEFEKTRVQIGDMYLDDTEENLDYNEICDMYLADTEENMVHNEMIWKIEKKWIDEMHSSLDKQIVKEIVKVKKHGK